MACEPKFAAPNSSADDLHIECIQDPQVLAGMRTEWNELVAQSRAAVFNDWDWLHTWHRHIAPQLRPWVLTARDSHRNLLGLMPLGLEEKWLGPKRVRQLSFLGEQQVGSDYLDVLAMPLRREPITRAFAKALLDDRAHWDVLSLNEFDEASPTPNLLSACFDAQVFQRRSLQRFQCPYETFAEGEGFEQFLHRTKRRENYLRRKKWLEAQSGYRIEISTEATQLGRPMTEFFRLHALRWQADGGSAGINGARVEAFHRDATYLLAQQGKLRLYTLWLGDEALASVYGIVNGDTFYYYQSGMDPKWRGHSVGLVLLGKTFEDAIGLGLRHYDFLRGDEVYKSEWASKVRHTTGLQIYRKTGAGAWFVMFEDASLATKAFVRRQLPADLVHHIQAARRRRAALYKVLSAALFELPIQIAQVHAFEPGFPFF